MKTKIFTVLLCTCCIGLIGCDKDKDNEPAAPKSVEAVDLGLSVKWASCNVGASKPEEYGDYFAWGETRPKNDYDLDTYKHYKYSKGSPYNIIKYCTSSEHGTVDNKTILDPEDDAAHVNWGGAWRMPTDAEQGELMNINNCTWTWTSDYKGTGVKGYIVSSKKNGNSIFLPAAGERNFTDLSDVGENGNYWSSSLYTQAPDYAYKLYFHSRDVKGAHIFRDDGQSIRPVCP